MLSRPAILVVMLAILGAGAALAPSAGATKPCPVEYCTDPDGEYVLEVAPLTGNPNPFIAAYAVCTWNVHVDFGDGSSEDYVFDGSLGLVGSHLFPDAGRTYTVLVKLTNGSSSDPDVFCFDYQITSEVRYRTPDEEADDPGEGGEEGGDGDPEGPPEGDPVAGESPPENPAAEPVGSLLGASAPERVAAPERAAYWRRCRKGVLTHLVGCRVGRRVARLAGARLTRQGSRRVAGFRCRLRGSGVKPIVCQRRRQRILAPA